MTESRDRLALGTLATMFGTRLGAMSINRLLRVSGLKIIEGNKAEKIAYCLGELYRIDKNQLLSFIDSLASIHSLNEGEIGQVQSIKEQMALPEPTEMEEDAFYKYLNECLSASESLEAEEGRYDSTIITLCKRLNEMQSDFTVVDFGCGKGRLLSVLKNMDEAVLGHLRYIGVDINQEILSENEDYIKSSGLEKKLRGYKLLSEEQFKEKSLVAEFIFMVNVLHEITTPKLPFIMHNLESKMKTDSKLIIHEMRELPRGELRYVTWDQYDFREFYKNTDLHISTLNFETKVKRIYADVIKNNDEQNELKTYILGYYNMLRSKIDKINYKLAEIERVKGDGREYGDNLIVKNSIIEQVMDFDRRQFEINPYNIDDIEKCPLCESEDINGKYNSDDVYGIEEFTLHCQMCGWNETVSL